MELEEQPLPENAAPLETPVETATPAEAPAPVWPAAPAVDGLVYGFVDNQRGDQQPMAAMTMTTWDAFTAQQQELLRRVQTLSGQLKQQQLLRIGGAKLVLPGN